MVYGLVLFGIITCSSFIFGTSLYSAMAAPLRWSARELRAISRILSDIGTYIARRRSWSLLQEITFGLEGYIFEVPDATRVPTFTCPAVYKYEDLPRQVEERALSKRDEWMKRAFGDVARTLSKMAAPDLSSVLKLIETDLALVHASYYTDDECIERIADWIAGKA